jgi:NTE family protein
MSVPQPLTLAFGGGGAKCAAQAGILSVLEEAGLPIGPMVGVSGGGVVAILYGLGYSPLQIKRYFAETQLLDVWEPDPARRALFGAERIRARLRQFVGDKTFADLQRPAIVMSVDMNTSQPVRLNSGRLDDALMATIGIPGLFPQIPRDGQLLADGGMLNPLPVEVARDLGPRVVALDVLHHTDADETQHILETRGVLRYVADAGKRLGYMELAGAVYQSLRLIMNRVSEQSLQLYPPDAIVRPEVGKVGLFAFDLADFAYEMGEIAARAALPELNALAQTAPKQPSRLKRLWMRLSRRRPKP